jgi:spore germination protein KA
MGKVMDKNKKSRDQLIHEDFNYKDLDLCSSNILDILSLNSDFIHRELFIHNNRNLYTSLFYIDGLINPQLVSDYIIKPLMQTEKFKSCCSEIEIIQLIEHGVIYSADVKKRTKLNEVIDDILTGSTAIVFDKHGVAFTFDTKGFEKRGVQEPSIENVIKGSKDSFTETLRVNTSICRRKIKSPNLVIEEVVIGKQSKTPVAIVYLRNIANQELLDKVKKRLTEINIDVLLTAGFIEEFIIDKQYSMFPQVQTTERPDKLCSNISEGRIGLLIDGLPISFIVPATLLQFLQAPEDYSMHWIISSTLRVMRFISLAITLLLPAFYVSITNFHQEMIPAELAFSIIASRQGVPFPMFVEVLIMLGAFELLVEAGLRLPKTIGQAVSIVGALVVGQSAVEAKLISPATVVIIAITAITGFTMPSSDFSNASRVWRLVITILACLTGMYGLTMGLILLLHHWCSIETYGVPYLSPFVGSKISNHQDSLIRFPASAMKQRPQSTKPINKTRIKQR